jgi:hypothetical protein
MLLLLILLRVYSTPSKRNISSNNKAKVLVSDDDNDGDDNHTPIKNTVSPSKIRNITERSSNDDITSRYKMPGKRVSSSKSRMELGSDDEDLLSPFEDAKPRHLIKRRVLSFDVLTYFNRVSYIFYSDSTAKVDQDNEQDDSGTVFLADQVTRSSIVPFKYILKILYTNLSI